MKIFKPILIKTVLLLSSLGTIAQITNTKNITVKDLTKPYFNFGFEMLSNSVWAGRQSTPSSYLTPSITYHHKRFCLTSSFTYQNKQGIIDNYSIIIGDTLKLFNNINAYGSVQGSLFNSNSTNILASNNYVFGGGFSYDLGPFSFNADGSLVFLKDPIVKGTDQFISFSIAYNYSIGNWGINPSITNNIGTRKFFLINKNNDYESRKPNYIYEVFNPVANKLQVLDYEFNLPITYTAFYKGRQWSLSFNPTLAMPVNNLTYTISRAPISHETSFVTEGYLKPSIEPIWYFDLTFSANF